MTTLPGFKNFYKAKELYALRKKGVLVIGSGNMVHNSYTGALSAINVHFGVERW